MLYVLASITLKPGSLKAVLAAAAPCLQATRKETGCFFYDLHQSVSDPDTLIFVERWQDRAALDAHLKQPHLVQWREHSQAHIVSRNIEIIENGDVTEIS